MGHDTWGRYEGGLARTVKILNMCGMALLLGVAIIVTSDVVLRYAFGRPLTGSNEFCELMMIVIVYFAMARVEEQKGHIRVDLVYQLLPARAKTALDRTMVILGIAIASMVVWEASVTAMRLFKIGKISDILGIPIAPFHLAMAFGFAAFCLVMFSDLVRSFSEKAEA